MPRTTSDLFTAIRDLHKAIRDEAAIKTKSWKNDIEQPGFAASANNLAQYLAFRHRDLRELQLELMRHGLSSLGRLESRVSVNLQAVESALELLLEEERPPAGRPPSREAFFAGELRLHENTASLLGRAVDEASGHIMVTLATEAAQEPGYMLELVRRGADLVRINCAHDTAGDWAAMMEAICLPPNVLAQLSVGAEVALDDGKLTGVVEAVERGRVVVHVQRTQLKGFKMKPERGMTFPRADLHLDPLTADDLIDLDFVARNADMVGFSFVQSADDISLLQDELAKRRPDWRSLGIIAKIETGRAVTNLPEIIVRAAGKQPFGVMIARGDLAIAIGFERLAEMQEEILWICEAAHVPVIWATQVLEAMVKSGLPTRGEMTDAAMAARAECVMLNKGPNVGEAITALRGLLRRMAEHQSKKTPWLRALRSW
jgi:pyruvate kinase